MRKLLVALVVALLLAALVSSAAYARPNEWTTIKYHTVRHGETLFSIGRLYGVSPYAIASHNGIANPNCIYPWQVLAIPNAYTWCYWKPPCHPPYHPPYTPHYPYGCTCRFSHQVQGGENLYRISLHYGVSMWHIARCNHISNINYIQLGSTLCIP